MFRSRLESVAGLPCCLVLTGPSQPGDGMYDAPLSCPLCGRTEFRHRTVTCKKLVAG